MSSDEIIATILVLDHSGKPCMVFPVSKGKSEVLIGRYVL